SPDGKHLLFAGWNLFAPGGDRVPGEIEVWDVKKCARLHALRGPEMPNRITFSPDGRLFAVSGQHDDAQVWDVASGKRLGSWKPGGTAAFSPDGKLLASGGTDAVSYWQAPSGTFLRKFPSGGGPVWFSPEGKRLAVSGARAVEIRDVATGKELVRLTHLPG